jgi:F-type H+-transporting ATPase subunit gamma
MPNIRQIRNHVVAVESARTVTKALQMISASRLQRTQRRRLASRPLAEAINELALAAIRGAGDRGHPLLSNGPGEQVRLIVLASDRGMCGGYNSRVVAAAFEAAAQIHRIQQKPQFHVVGRRGAFGLRDRLASLGQGAAGMTDEPAFDELQIFPNVARLAQQTCRQFQAGELASVSVVHMRLGGQGLVHPVTEPLLPVTVGPSEVTASTQFELLPDVPGVLDSVLPLVVRARLYQAVLDALVAEHTARLMAMKAASTNAEDMIRDLTQQMNRVRQTRITAELSEIVGGADAVEGVR